MRTLIIKKGGPGSGNYGHGGRPGKIGGSAPKTGIGAVMSIRTGKTAAARQRAAAGKQESTKDKLKKMKEEGVRTDKGRLSDNIETNNIANDIYEAYGLDGDVELFANNAYNFNDEQSGMYSEVTAVWGYNRSVQISIEGKVYDRDGQKVGKFERTLFMDAGVSTIHNDIFTLKPSVRGSGFGRRFYKNSEETYLRAGITQVTMTANMSVGGYAWARMGYDFANARDQNDAIIRYSNANGLSLSSPLLTGTPAWKLAAMSGPGLASTGKDVMLGSSWAAVKPMDPDDEGFLAGYEYMGG